MPGGAYQFRVSARRVGQKRYDGEGWRGRKAKPTGRAEPRGTAAAPGFIRHGYHRATRS